MLLILSLVSVFCVISLAAESSPKPPGLVMDLEVVHDGYLEEVTPHKALAKRSEMEVSETDIKGLHPHAKRSESTEIKNMLTSYVLNMRVGSNGDTNKIMIDTCSSELWVMSNELACEYAPSGMPSPSSDIRHPQIAFKHSEKVSDCQILGFFRQRTSKTFYWNDSDPQLNSHYLDSTYASGIYGTDTVNICNAEVSMIFGVATKTSCAAGKLGLGPMIHDTTSTFNNKKASTSFLKSLKKSGIIKKGVYSIFFNQSSSSTGRIYFGVVDHKKYHGRLQTVPIVNLYKDVKKLDVPAIKLDQIYMENGNFKVHILDEPIGAILDTGATIQHWPESVLRLMATLLSGKYLSHAEMYQIDCGYSKRSKLVFDFSGIKINVPISEIVIMREGLCYLAAKSSKGSSYFKVVRLGTSFLRNAYIVYDMQDLEISMAQARYSTEEELEEVFGAVPRASKAAVCSALRLSIDKVGLFG